MREIMLRFRKILILAIITGPTIATVLGLPQLMDGMANSRVHCESPETKSIIHSPDGTHEARLDNQLCDLGFAGTEKDGYSVVLHNNGDLAAPDIEVFRALNAPPDITWLDGRTIVFMINWQSEITTSLHQVDGITIIYRLADRLSADSFRKELKETEQNWSKNALTDQAQTALNNMLEMRKENYRRFKEWAKLNAENGEITNPNTISTRYRIRL